jgi:VanZ family protein
MRPALTSILRWFPAFAWMGVIFYWSSQSSIPTSSTIVSKLAHVTEYSLLAGLLAFGFAPSGRWALRAWIGATLYAASDELHQSFTPGRHPMLPDVALDGAAAALSLQVLRAIAARRINSTSAWLAGRRTGGANPDDRAPLSSAHGGHGSRQGPADP